jgi:signal transduction histidine kinase
LPPEYQIYAQVGNAMQFVGVGIELAAYCAFLGVPQWHKRVGVPVALSALIFGLFVVFGAVGHTTIAMGTAFGGAAYLAMGLLMLRQSQKDPVLTRVLGVFDCILALLLLTKVALGLSGVELVAYAANGVNEAIYTAGFVVLMSNGFGFLLLTKQDDDHHLRRLVDELSATDTTQRHFIAMLSHEVRSPVAVISATTQLLSLHLQDHPQHQPLLQRLQRGVSRLSHFFDNCLTQDRVSSQSYTLKPSEVELVGLIQMLRESAEALSDGHRLILELPHSPVRVSGDAVLLRIALMNLLANAFKFSPPSSVVNLQVTRHGTQCRIAVRDQGPGVPETDREFIFQKYRRGPAAEHTPGAGLGLAIVKNIVDLHYGLVYVDSAPEGGAMFVIELPCMQVGAGPMQ